MSTPFKIEVLNNNTIAETYSNEKSFNKGVFENPEFFYNKKVKISNWNKIFISNNISDELVKDFEHMSLKNMNDIWILEMICWYDQEWNENEEFNDIYYVK